MPGFRGALLLVQLQYLVHKGELGVLKLFLDVFPHNLGFFLFNDEVSIGVLCVAQEMVVVDLNLSVLITELKSQLYVLRKCLRFLLGQ